MRTPPQTTPNGTIASLVKSWDAARGKTIASVIEEDTGESQYMVFRFTDQSGLLLKRTGEDSNLNDEPSTLETWDGKPFQWFSDELWDRVYFGLAPGFQWQVLQDKHEAKEKAREEQSERAEYKRLKAKFGAP